MFRRKPCRAAENLSLSSESGRGIGQALLPVLSLILFAVNEDRQERLIFVWNL
jgi:hypothetical protein